MQLQCFVLGLNGSATWTVFAAPAASVLWSVAEEGGRVKGAGDHHRLSRTWLRRLMPTIFSALRGREESGMIIKFSQLRAILQQHSQLLHVRVVAANVEDRVDWEVAGPAEVGLVG